MNTSALEMSGTVHGNSIEADQSLGLPEGLKVKMVVSFTSEDEAVTSSVPPGLLRAFGACAHESDEVDKFLVEYRELRKLETSSRELEP
ncbi:hypothetical protein [Aeoliella sp. SH292]|uniref:hypothetical protein n=1 Tax=Aeoliella sp. SH292 TaxID=3454464 RepID=UPI003F9A30B9